MQSKMSSTWAMQELKVTERPVRTASSDACVLHKMRGGVSENGRRGRGEGPEGERSPREHRVEAWWQHRVWTTDSTMEQGLEVGDGAARRTALVATWVQRSGLHVGSGDQKHFGVEGKRGRHPLNGGKATVAVTQCGCWRGKSFGGCEGRVRGKPRGLWKVARLKTGDGAGNGSNPMTGSRVQ